jgi:acetyltransferase-like isoleucine patch superfamily enzyme
MLLDRGIRRIRIISKKIYYKLFFGNIVFGKGLNFRRNFLINVSKNGKVIIGNNVFFNNDISLNSHELISIGNDCVFGENVKIYDHNHKFADANTGIGKQGYTCRPVHIGNNCWIGSGVIILAGSTIGDHIVIGAGCVINGNIESNTIVRLKQEKCYDKIEIQKKSK